MANIIAQILISLNLLLGPGSHSVQASQIYATGGYTCNGGIVIIDTDEL